MELQINGWAVLGLPDEPTAHEPLTDGITKGFGKQIAPMRPVFTPDSPKRELIEAFEAFAKQRRLDYEMQDDLKDED